MLCGKRFRRPDGSTTRSTLSGPAPPGQRILPAAEVDETGVPYFSLAMLPGGRRRTAVVPAGTVAVVGLGPGGNDWMTPQSRRELAAATDLIGYGGYLDRVPVRDGQQRHPSDNTDEPARARLACALAEQGRAVAVVSSGDPGVFAMATAVLEEAKQWPGVQIRVIPAMTAAQAVASRVGAPLGHDYAVISLSDRLKPWEVIAARLAAAAAADLVLAIYNPASKTRTWQVGAMRDVLLAHREPGTPVVIGRNVSRARRRRPRGAAGRPQPRRRRHALPADRRVLSNPVVLRRFRRPGVYSSALPGLNPVGNGTDQIEQDDADVIAC